MHRFRRYVVTTHLLVSASLTGWGCVYPTDRSQELSVEMTQIPTLFLKDTLQLDAQLVDAGGNPVSNAVIAFSTGDPTVLTVDPSGRVLAVGVGTASVTATALGFQDATPVTQPAVVRGLLEVDSVRPANPPFGPMSVLFGDTLHIFGVGLLPDSLFQVAIGGEDAVIAGFVPDDPAQPERFGKLSVWVPPPADRRSSVTVLGFAGGVVTPDSLDVLQFDVYEPNDTSLASLGSIPFGFRNPALAFEVRGRSDVEQPADWYRFTNTTAQDRTILVRSDAVGAETFAVFITDSLFWSSAAQTYGVGSESWTIGPQSHLCGGQPITSGGVEFTIEELPFPAALIALRNLPAGTYDILIPYVPAGDPSAYEVLILSQYFSLIQADVAEENDYCDVAPNLSTFAAGEVFSIDNFHDIDWFRFSVPPGPGQSEDIKATATTAVAFGEAPDLDLYIVADLLPDSLPLVELSTAFGTTATLSVPALPPGDYFLIVVDFPGVPTEYTLSTTFAAPMAASAAAAPALEAPTPLEALEQKRRLAASRRGPRLRFR